MPRARPRTAVEILLVEDSRDDADLMIEALREGRLDVRVTLVEDGEQAVHYLRGGHAVAGRPLPELVLLDLYLPRKNGHEVLADVKADPVLRRIPIMILTSSDNEKEILTAYDLHANCCITKPADQEQFAQAVRRIEHFWVNVASRAPGPPLAAEDTT